MVFYAAKVGDLDGFRKMDGRKKTGCGRKKNDLK